MLAEPLSADVLHFGDDVVLIRDALKLQDSGIRHRDVQAANAPNRSVQRVETLAADSSRDLSAKATALPVFVDHDCAVGLLDRTEDRVRVQREKRSNVDHFGIDAFGSQLLSRSKADMNHSGIGDQRNIRTLTSNPRLAERHHEVGIGIHFSLDGVQAGILGEDDRVVVSDRAP